MAEPNFQRLPLTIRHGPLSGYYFVGLGALGALLPTVTELPWEFGLLGGIFFLLGIFGVGTHSTIEITRDHVRVKYGGLLNRRTDWDEPVSAFRCIRLMEDPIETMVCYEVWLIHPDQAKWLSLVTWTGQTTFGLGSSDTKLHAQKVLREAGHALNLPTIETGTPHIYDEADMQQKLDDLSKSDQQ